MTIIELFLILIFIALCIIILILNNIDSNLAKLKTGKSNHELLDKLGDIQEEMKTANHLKRTYGK